MNARRIAQLKALMEADPHDPFLPYAIAQEYMAAEKWGEAITLFASLTEDFPDYLPAYYHYGISLVTANHVEEAIQVLRKGHDLAQRQRDGKTAGEIAALLEDLE